MGRLDWEPLTLQYLIERRESALAAGDQQTLTLLREISRLHWIVVRANHLVLTLTIPGSNITTVKSVADDMRNILEREPAVIKDNFVRDESRRRPPGTPYSRKMDRS